MTIATIIVIKLVEQLVTVTIVTVLMMTYRMEWHGEKNSKIKLDLTNKLVR